MKNIIKYALAATVCSVMLSSCDLNILPNSAIAYDENGQLIQTTSNLTSLENGMLASFRSYQRGTYVLSPELQFDLFNASVDYDNNYGSLHKSDYNFNSGTYEPGYMWQQGYSVIKNCNIIIAAADNVPDEIAAATQIVKGEAYFFRAASYLQLARQFGKHASKAADTDLCVPLVLVFNTSERPARATVKEVYAQIKQDLTDAASLLAGVNGAPLSYRPTIDAVNALFARYYLDMGDYTNAAAYAHKVIDTGKYELASTVEEMEDVYIYDKGTEAIMQCFASIAEGPNGLNDWTLCQSDATYGQCLRPYYLPTQTVIDLYEESDLRFQTWYDNTEYVFINGNYFKGEFYTFVKYWGNPLLTSSPIRNGLNAAKPLKIGEMYLIAAEAELAGNNTAAAQALAAAIAKDPSLATYAAKDLELVNVSK